MGDKGGKLKISGLWAIVLDEFNVILQYNVHKEPTMAIIQVLEWQHGREHMSLQRVMCSLTSLNMMAPPPPWRNGNAPSTSVTT